MHVLDALIAFHRSAVYCRHSVCVCVCVCVVRDRSWRGISPVGRRVCVSVRTFARSDAEGRSIVYTAAARQLGHSVSLKAAATTEHAVCLSRILVLTLLYGGAIQGAPKSNLVPLLAVV